ncbi:MAG: SRPBCC family protein [Deltaproteobacteria bacterium]|nr:SRPBCC family protein [Deltaproteobacteria bacterium]
MLHLVHSIVIQSKIDNVYAIAEKINKFPEFMPHVKTSKIIKKGDNKRQVEMSAVVNGIKSHWISASTLEKNKKITYYQIKGFCKTMGGEWLFEKVSKGTKISLAHNFDVGLPLIGRLIERLIVKKWVNKYSLLTLGAIKTKAESD